ncbi:hypothetical protein [Aquimarina algiphila]|uniref:hypothetical protein n=1 Tax=Aquimarina algiphila TaxID=2047982 RepID=UPI00232EA231|nr:hypothetical protein [Aquimarina algiphila]
MTWITIEDQRKFKPVLVEHKIICKPKDFYCINKEDVKPGKRSRIQEANDLFFVKNVSDLFVFKMFIMIWLFLTLIMSIADDLIVNLMPLPLLLIALWDWALYYFNPPKEIVLDCLNGTITYPKRFFYKTPITVPFLEIKFYEKLGRYNDSESNFGRNKYLYLKHPNHSRKIDVITVDVNNYRHGSPTEKLCEARSFYVWYMDKNRPLPPGTAFDHFRKKDFDRRYKKGFINSLYTSLICTTEANRYQQKIKKEYLNQIHKDKI